MSQDSWPQRLFMPIARNNTIVKQTILKKFKRINSSQKNLPTDFKSGQVNNENGQRKRIQLLLSKLHSIKRTDSKLVSQEELFEQYYQSPKNSIRVTSDFINKKSQEKKGHGHSMSLTECDVEEIKRRLFQIRKESSKEFRSSCYTAMSPNEEGGIGKMSKGGTTPVPGKEFCLSGKSSTKSLPKAALLETYQMQANRMLPDISKKSLQLSKLLDKTSMKTIGIASLPIKYKTNPCLLSKIRPYNAFCKICQEKNKKYTALLFGEETANLYNSSIKWSKIIEKDPL